MSGRVYRRCGCRDEAGRVVGASCPRLAADDRHGTWTFATDLPNGDGARKTMRRGGFATKREASRALTLVGERAHMSVQIDDRQTVAAYLAEWLHAMRHELAAKTLHQYGLYVTNDLVPALGAVRLEALRHEHVVALVADLERAGRGATTVERIVAVLSSALNHAVRTRRLTHNVCAHVSTPAVTRTEVNPWTADQAATFLEAVAGDRLGEFFEVLVGTGLRLGEALALRWEDVDLEHRVLRVRRSVTTVGGRLVIGRPKTVGSAAGVGLSPRVVAALLRQRERQVFDVLTWSDGYSHGDLVFAREDGSLLRPEYVRKRLHLVAATAGLPRVRVHDLRHLAATLMISAGVPLALVSKTLRHSKVSITVDLYGHLTHEAAQAAADSLGGVLDAATARRSAITP
jgi:integrase